MGPPQNGQTCARQVASLSQRRGLLRPAFGIRISVIFLGLFVFWGGVLEFRGWGLGFSVFGFGVVELGTVFFEFLVAGFWFGVGLGLWVLGLE